MGTTGGADNLCLLREAIARNASLVLSLPLRGLLQHHKSRFLADAGDGFWVAAVADEPGVIHGLITTREPAGVSFRSGDVKVIFATRVQHQMPDFRPSRDVDVGAVPALLLQFPEQLRSVQRRKSFRVPVATGSTALCVRVWAVPEQASLRDKPAAGMEIDCEPRDVGIGGIGVILRPSGGAAPAHAPGQRLRVQLTLGATVALLEGRLRYAPRPSNDGSFRMGVQFRALGDSRDDRHAASQLEKIVGHLQRDLARRRNLELPVAG